MATNLRVKTLVAENNLTIKNGRVEILDNTNSSSASSGALVVSGGLGVSGNIFYNGTLQNSSDMRFKEELTPLADTLPKINQIQALKYIRNDRTNPQVEIGMLAQEVQSQFPELVAEDKTGYLSLDYARFTTVLLSSVKELHAEIQKLKDEIRDLKK